jgi:hypothetical protein
MSQPSRPAAVLLTLCAAPLLLAMPAAAQQEAVRAACMQDIQRLCPGQFANRDRDAIRACLRSRIADTSDGCRSAIRAQMQANRQTSGGEAQTKR